MVALMNLLLTLQHQSTGVLTDILNMLKKLRFIFLKFRFVRTLFHMSVIDFSVDGTVTFTGHTTKNNGGVSNGFSHFFAAAVFGGPNGDVPIEKALNFAASRLDRTCIEQTSWRHLAVVKYFVFLPLCTFAFFPLVFLFVYALSMQHLLDTDF